MGDGKSAESWNRQTAGGTIPLLLGGSLSAAVACLAILALVAPSAGNPLESPPRSLLSGFGLVGLACPLCVAGLLLRGPFPRWRRWGRCVVATVFSAAFLCLTFGLIGIVLGAYPLARLFFGL